MTTPQDPDTAAGPERPAAPPDAPRRLTRSTADRMLGGVGGGLGRYFGIDPLLFRVAFAVLALAGGAGVLAYVALWLFVPDDSPGAEAPAASRTGGVLAAAVVLVIVAIGIGGVPFGFLWGPGFLIGALLAVAVVAAAVASQSGARGPLAAIVTAAGVVIGSVVLALVAGLIAAAGGGVVVAAVVIAAGAGLVAAAFVGGARWLILPALAVGAAGAFVAAADISLSGGVGERSYRPASVAAIQDRYEIGLGELRVDLRDVAFPPGEHVIDVEVGIGEARILVPDDVCAAIAADMGAGYAELYEAHAGGVDVALSERPEAPAGTPRILVNADVGVGAVQVDSRDGDFGGRFDDDFPRWDWHDPDRSGEGGAACA